MAKIKLGALAGQVSGSIGAETYAHNRFGSYIRLRSIPVQPDSARQLMRRAVLSALSSDWSTLTAGNRLSWKMWAQNNPIVDSLGDKRILSGHMAYVALNARLQGLALPTFDTPPVQAASPALTGLSIAASVATQEVTVTFTPANLPADDMLYIKACKTPTPTINYIKNLLRFLGADAVLGGSPYTCTAVATVCGALTLDETIILMVAVLDNKTGLLSPFRQARCQVAA